MFGFIGPNGAGKTTTMRILATLLNPTWGEAYGVRLLDLQRRQGDSPRDRLHARLLRRVRRHEGDRVPGVLRGRLPHQGPGAAQEVRPGARAGRPRLQARRPGHQPVARHDAAARPGPRAAARAAGAAARRAGQRPRPAGPHRDARPAQRAAQHGQDDPGLQPHPARAGRHLQQDRHHRARQAALRRRRAKRPSARCGSTPSSTSRSATAATPRRKDCSRGHADVDERRAQGGRGLPAS